MNSKFALKPITSEKTYALSQSNNVYVFEVPLKENKLTVKSAVENQFSVKVEDVRILRISEIPEEALMTRVFKLDLKKCNQSEISN